MALGFRHLTAERIPANVSDVREKTAILEDLFAQLEALNIGWSFYKTTYSNTSYTSTSCYGYTFIRYKDNEHLIRFTVSGGNVSASSMIVGALMIAGLNETTALITWGSNISLYSSSSGAAPYPMALGLSVYFGGDDWSALLFATGYYTYTSRVLIATPTYYNIFGATMEQSSDSTETSTYIGFNNSSSPVSYSAGYESASDTRTTICSPAIQSILPQSPDFELVGDSFVYRDNRKIRSSKNFSNSWGYAMGTVITINSEKWILVSSAVILKLYDPPSP